MLLTPCSQCSHNTSGEFFWILMIVAKLSLPLNHVLAKTASKCCVTALFSKDVTPFTDSWVTLWRECWLMFPFTFTRATEVEKQSYMLKLHLFVHSINQIFAKSSHSTWILKNIFIICFVCSVIVQIQCSLISLLI